MGTLRDFAVAADAIRSTASKLEKRRILGEFLRGLPDGDLAPAALFFTGTAFPPHSGKVLQAGGAALSAAALAVTGASSEALGEAYLRWSDAGDALGELWERHGSPGAGPSGHSLADIKSRFEEIAATPAGAPKIAAVTELFAPLDAAEARYVAKILTGELRIGLQEGLVEEGIAAAFECKLAAIRKAHQLAGDLGRVAVGARHGTLDLLCVELFSPLKPMLASPESTPEAIAQRVGPELWIEDKFDGIRAQAHVGPTAEGERRVALFSRDLKDVSAQFPEVVAALSRLPGSLILDGELLAFKDGRAMPFFALQKRLGRKTLTPKVLAEVPVCLLAFDLLYQDGEPLLDFPLQERRARLDALPLSEGVLPSPLRVRTADGLEAEFDAAKARANEGLMVKHPDSAYTPGRRGYGWLKYKKPLEPLDVVVTGVEYGHGKRRGVLSDYTFAVRNGETGELVNIGKAYTGLTDAEIAELTDYFIANTLQDLGRFRLVKPELVIEVAFEAIQESPRHKSGFALRFPRIVRLRRDKAPAEASTLEDVRDQYRRYRSVYEAAAPTGAAADSEP